MKKLMKLTAVALTALAVLTGCAAPSAAAASGQEAEEAARSALITDETLPDASVTERDASGEYDASGAKALSPEDELTITEAGEYILSGEYVNKTVTVDAPDDAKVQLVLKNAVLTNENGPAVYVRSADKVFLTAAAGTVNEISDGNGYSVTDGDTELDAAVFSKDDLTINGSGELTINGNYKHAVVSKDDLVVTASALTVNAVKAGLSGKDSVRLSGAGVTVTAGSDGLRADNDTDADRGYISVVDSTLTVTAGKDGVQAETVFTAEGSAITVTSGGGSGARLTDSSESYKGLKAGSAIVLGEGTYVIDSPDDGIHTDGSITVTAGSYTVRSADDGFHADETIEISGGTLDITAAEGIEATYILISGGTIDITASDDGINAARKSTVSTPTVEITGGEITIAMGAGDTDGIDSNGNIIISGGVISVTGNSAFDYDGTASFTGGTVYVNGQQVTTLTNQFMGGGMGGMGGPGMGSQGGPGGQGGRRW